MKYRAKPVTVDALKIAATHPRENDGAGLPLVLEDGSTVVATPEMTARMEPVACDYVVTQEDGYVYLNPKAVFERKYEPLP